MSNLSMPETAIAVLMALSTPQWLQLLRFVAMPPTIC
jgi:hypothetical protein